MILWLASWPRSGNTLLRMCLEQAFGLDSYSRYNDERDLGANARVADAVGHHAWSGSFDEFRASAARDARWVPIKTHHLPDDDAPAIYVIRDGRSACVSYLHYLEHFGSGPVTLEDVIIGATPFGSWSEHVEAWRPLERPKTLVVRYESLCEEPQAAIEAIAELIGVAPRARFENQFAEMQALLPTFFRSGKDAGNVAEFPADLLPLFDLLHGEVQQGLGYPRPPIDAARRAEAARSLARTARRGSLDARDLDQKLRTAHARSSHLERVAEIRAARLDAAERRASDAAASITDLRSRLADAERQLTALRGVETANRELEQSLAAARRDNRQLAQDLDAARRDVSQATQDLDAARRDVSQATQDLDVAHSAAAESERRARDLEVRLNRRNSAYSHVERVASMRADKIDELQRALIGSPLDILRARRRAARMLRAIPGDMPAPPQNEPGPPPARATPQSTRPVPPAVPEALLDLPPQGLDDAEGLGIALFGFARADMLRNALVSLGQQRALRNVHVFLDGDQGNPARRAKIDEVARVVAGFPVHAVHRRRGNLGFRKMMLQAMQFMCEHYDEIIFLEDDCFPASNCISVFRRELEVITGLDDVFSVYGHPFLVPAETDYCTRFQGWGWATTAEKLRPLVAELLRCYLMLEEEFLEFTAKALTPEVRAVIDVTPGRQPSTTLEVFFAWDETLCLLTALRGLKHRRTPERVIFNCGADPESSHFANIDHYRRPPFNMIAVDEVWDHFQ